MNSLCTTPWESKKLSKLSWCGAFGISVSSAEGMSHQAIQNSVALFRSHRQNDRSHLPNNFVKKILYASTNAIMSWQDVTRSSLCSGVKECGTKRAHNFLFPKSSFRIRRTTVLAMLKDSAVILDAIRVIFDYNSNSSSVYLTSSRFWTDTSLVTFYQLSSVSESRIPPKKVWLVQSLIPISLLHQY
jgi:hypothetical protein